MMKSHAEIDFPDLGMGFGHVRAYMDGFFIARQGLFISVPAQEKVAQEDLRTGQSGVEFQRGFYFGQGPVFLLLLLVDISQFIVGHFQLRVVFQRGAEGCGGIIIKLFVKSQFAQEEIAIEVLGVHFYGLPAFFQGFRNVAQHLMAVCQDQIGLVKFRIEAQGCPAGVNRLLITA